MRENDLAQASHRLESAHFRRNTDEREGFRECHPRGEKGDNEGVWRAVSVGGSLQFPDSGGERRVATERVHKLVETDGGEYGQSEVESC